MMEWLDDHPLCELGAVAAAIVGIPVIMLMLLYGTIYAFAQSSPQSTQQIGNCQAQRGGQVINACPTPTLSGGCGTGATVSGADAAGRVALGTSTSQPCTINFVQPFTIDAPTCVVTGESYTPSYNRKPFGINITSLVDSAIVNWHCVGRTP